MMCPPLLCYCLLVVGIAVQSTFVVLPLGRMCPLDPEHSLLLWFYPLHNVVAYLVALVDTHAAN